MWGSFLIAFQTQRDLARPQTQMGGISAYHTKPGRGRFEGGLFRLLLLETFLWQVLFLIGRKCCVSCTMCLVGRQLWVCVCHCCLLQQPPAELISVSFLSGGAIKSFKYTSWLCPRLAISFIRGMKSLSTKRRKLEQIPVLNLRSGSDEMAH